VTQSGIAASVVPGIPDNFGVSTIFTNRTIPDATATFTVTEGHRTAWFNDTTTQFPGAPADWTNDASFRLTFSGIPAGVTLNLQVAGSTIGAAPGTACITLQRNTITTANNTSNVTFTCDLATSNSSNIDQVQFTLDVSNISSSASLSGGNITVQATMIPIGAALQDVTPALPDFSTSPRFSELQTNAIPVVTIVAANTTLLIPFAVRDGAFDTGLSLANTSADPFGATGGATAQSGAIRLDFFPRAASGAGTAFSATTSSSLKPGIGLSADGTLAAGSTWTVLLSELLTAAGQTGAFTGYIWIRADFLGAHGAPFVSDFRNFTSFTPMLVLQPPSITGRFSTSPVESLGF
jgi:hypothetical protein